MCKSITRIPKTNFESKDPNIVAAVEQFPTSKQGIRRSCHANEFPQCVRDFTTGSDSPNAHTSADMDWDTPNVSIPTIVVVACVCGMQTPLCVDTLSITKIHVFHDELRTRIPRGSVPATTFICVTWSVYENSS